MPERVSPKKIRQTKARIEAGGTALALLEHVKEGIFIARARKLLFVNKTLSEMICYSTHEMVGKDPTEFVVSEQRDLLRHLLSSRRRKGGEGELLLLNKDGTTKVPVTIHVRPAWYQGGAVRIGTVKDISQLRKTMRALATSEKQYRDLYSNLSDGFAVVKMDGTIVETNDAFREMLGYRAEELHHLSYEDITPQAWHGLEREIIETQVMKRGYSKLYLKEYIRKDGTVFPVELRAYLMSDDLGKPRGMWVLVRDITERKAAESALRQSEDRYRTLFEDSRDAIAITDVDGRFFDANQAMLDLFGYTRKEIMAMSFGDLYARPDDAVEFRKEIARSGSVRDYEVRLLRKDGTVRDCLFIVTAKRGLDGTITGYQGIVRDVTEHKQMEEALRHSEKQYKKLSITDDLTGLHNSRHFYDQLEREVDRAARYKRPLAVLLLDVDNFKQYNDTYGHLAGDEVLARLGQVIRKSIRRTDSAYRYGGEEFTIILTETKGKEAVTVGERLRKEFSSQNFQPSSGSAVSMRISIGVTDYVEGEKITDLVKRADQNMYVAKNRGKDCVFYSPS
jgi:diguanylate cyclase (GGDEF)-like protein/PAS domain S-box-containing protein